LIRKLQRNFKLSKVKKHDPDIINEIVIRLSGSDVTSKRAFMGFDACIDILVRVVSERKEDNLTGYFSESRSLGEFLINLDNKSCGLELQTKMSKIGGNMVITANALGNLGVGVECVGTFGIPDILPVFRTMSENCSLHTIGETISATALEFSNSKVIMFDPGPYNNLTWDGIRDILGTEKITELLSGKQLISFVNWSEIENSSQIWQGILDEILPAIVQPAVKPYFFTDFSDCSRKSKESILFVIELLGRLSRYYKVHISLNQNEAALIAKALELTDYVSDEDFVRALYCLVNADVLIIHRIKDALSFDGNVYEKCETFLSKEPKILTGGGDNFNAGFCFSLLNEFSLFQSLLVANAVAGSYVQNGVSPDLDNLIKFLENSSR
jgi:hypothetical protein